MAMIEVMLQSGGLITLEDEANLVKRTGGVDNEVERTTWVEYRLKSDPDAERPVHRSVEMHLKTALFADPRHGAINQQPRVFDTRRAASGSVSFIS